MPQKPIVFAPIQQSGWEQLGGAPGPAINVVIDGRGVVRRRPALQAVPGLPSGVIDSTGLSVVHATLGGDVYAVGSSPGARNVYRLTTSSDQIAGFVPGTLRPRVAETEALLVFAGGAAMRKLELLDPLGGVSSLGGSPPVASHVIANASRLLGNDMVVDRSKVRYSEPSLGTASYTGHETWNFGGTGTSGFFSAEARPDPVVALGETTNETFVFGSTNVQVYLPDAQRVFAPATTREYGCAAPYSPVKADQSYAWIDHMRRIVISDGRGFEVISKEIQQVLNSMATVSDAFGYRVHVGPVDALVWTFPTDGRTLAYQRGGGWGTWMSRSGGNWSRFVANCHHHDPNNDRNLVGTTTGKVAQLVMGEDDDLGETIVASVETGYLDRGTTSLKHCKAVYVTVKRGQTAVEETAHLRYSDEPGRWSDPIEVRLGVAGDTYPVVPFRSLGTYRRRAWKFEFSGTSDLALVEVLEDFDVLDQ